MKASVFPTAYALAVTVNIQEGAVSFVGLALLVSLIASFAALAYFYRLMATRRTEHTAQTPPDLADAADSLRDLPGKNVLVLPTMYADYVAFNAEKRVLWGGHSGNLRKLEEFSPVLRKPLRYFLEHYAIDYVLLDRTYAPPERLQLLELVKPVSHFGTINLYAVLGSVGEWALSEPSGRAQS
jgi:hypothetical protein